MCRPFNKNLLRLIHLTDEMMALADEGEHHRDDHACGVLYSVMRDSANKLRDLARQECESHKQLDKWDTPDQLASESESVAFSDSASNTPAGGNPGDRA